MKKKIYVKKNLIQIFEETIDVLTLDIYEFTNILRNAQLENCKLYPQKLFVLPGKDLDFTELPNLFQDISSKVLYIMFATLI